MGILSKLFARPKSSAERSSGTIGTPTEANALVSTMHSTDIRAARRLLEAGANPNGRVFPLDQDLLNYAVGLSLSDFVELLLQFGADPNSANSIAGSPLGLAAGHGDAKSVQLLLAKGAKVNSQDADGWTPLMFGCGGEHPSAEVCMLLIKQGADVNARDKGGWTSLMNAAKYGNLSIVELLV